MAGSSGLRTFGRGLSGNHARQSRQRRFFAMRELARDKARRVGCHRQSPSVQAEYGLEDMALDVERLLDALNIRRAHVCGISLGGMIAQVLACQCPNRTATLTSISSAVGNPATGFGRLRAIAAVLRQDGGSKENAAKAHVQRVLQALAGSKYRPTPADIDEALGKAHLLQFDPQSVMRQVMAFGASTSDTGSFTRYSRYGRSASTLCRGRGDGASDTGGAASVGPGTWARTAPRGGRSIRQVDSLALPRAPGMKIAARTYSSAFLSFSRFSSRRSLASFVQARVFLRRLRWSMKTVPSK